MIKAQKKQFMFNFLVENSVKKTKSQSYEYLKFFDYSLEEFEEYYLNWFRWFRTDFKSLNKESSKINSKRIKNELGVLRNEVLRIRKKNHRYWIRIKVKNIENHLARFDYIVIEYCMEFGKKQQIFIEGIESFATDDVSILNKKRSYITTQTINIHKFLSRYFESVDII